MMPFQREFDATTGQFGPNRNRTGPPKPTAQTGTVVGPDGSIIADSSSIDIVPATPIDVQFPGPNVRVIDDRGIMNPHWYRFLSQLWLRTGGEQDNINRVPTTVAGGSSSTTVAVTFTGNAPTVEIDHFRAVSKGSLGFTGIAPTITVA